MLGLFAIAGVPPFSVFASELNIIIATFDARHMLIGGAVVILLAVVFAGIAATLFRMLYGTAKEDVKTGEPNRAGAAAILVLLVVICTTGLFMPDTVINLISDARDIVIGI